MFGKTIRARGRAVQGIGIAAAAAFWAFSGPAAFAGFELSEGAVAAGVTPEVEFGDDGPSGGRIGLKGRVDLSSGNSGYGYRLGFAHEVAGRSRADRLELGQQTVLSSRLRGRATVRGGDVMGSLETHYALGSWAFDRGRARSIGQLSVRRGDLTGRGNVGWRAIRSAGDEAWSHSGEVGFALTHVAPGHGQVGVFGRAEFLGDGRASPVFKGGLTVDLGVHHFEIGKRVRFDRKGRPRSAAMTSIYHWRIRGVGISVNADYTPATPGNASSFFAGLSLALGAPGSRDLLASIR